MTFDKFRYYMGLGRIQGASTTAAVSILGAYTACGNVPPRDIILLIVIGFFSHSSGAALNEICDKKLDSKVPGLSGKPLVKGAISTIEAYAFVLFGLFFNLFLIVYFFPTKAALVFVISYAVVALYSFKAKYVPIAFEITFPFGYALYSFFGVFAVGHPTPISWIVFISILLALVFNQWQNEMKDVDTDRMLNIPSMASRLNYTLGKKLKLKDPLILYALCLKFIFYGIYLLPLLFHLVSPIYFILFLIFGIPTQGYLIRNLFRMRRRSDWVKSMILDMTLTWILGPLLIIDIIGVIGVLGLLYLVIAGYFLGSLIEKGSEFKFRAWTR
ncbi:MAG: UbiA prenyltransferase family protein [Thermoplasmata archaeon]|nr:MAG: UbiA prenyltransferase family protein [Thermoplasmata archaeon]